MIWKCCAIAEMRAEGVDSFSVTSRAFERGNGSLRQVHFLQSFLSGVKAAGARSELLEFPRVGEHTPGAQGQAALQRAFQARKPRWHKLARFHESFHRSVAGAGRNQRNRGCATPEGELSGAHGPFDALVFIHEWRLDEYERAHRNTRFAQKLRGLDEMVQSELFVEAGQNFRMNSFEAHRDFQRAGEQALQSQRPLTNKSWMRFDNDILRERNLFGDRAVVLQRD